MLTDYSQYGNQGDSVKMLGHVTPLPKPSNDFLLFRKHPNSTMVYKVLKDLDLSNLIS